MPFEDLTTLSTRRGSIGFEHSASPAILLVTPRGYVGPTLVRRDLEFVRRFADEQTEPWWYVVDPTDAIPNPANIVFLRSIRRLSRLVAYYVVARRQPMHAISVALAGIGGPDRVFSSLEEALAACRTGQD